MGDRIFLLQSSKGRTRATHLARISKHVFGLSLLSLLFACSPLSPNKIKLGDQLQLQTGILGYWNFDEKAFGTAPGGKDFADISGSGHHGTSTGGITLGTYGPKNTAITSLGTGSVSIPIDLSQAKTLTISLWVNPHITTTNAHNGLFEYTPDSTSGNGFFAGLDDNSGTPLHSLLLWLHSPSGYFANTSPTLTPGWHNVITVLDRSNASQNSIALYVDGSLVSTSAITGSSSSSGTAFANSTLYLLCRAGGTLCLSADLDELVIWNRAVTPQEIQTIIAF